MFLSAPAALGQTASTGALTGTVKDSSGAVVPGATVTVTSIGTSQARTSVTSSSGTYRFGFLPPGTYKLKFEAAGFSTSEVPSVSINVTETPVFDQTLTVGSQTQEVEVRAEAEAVQSATATVGTVVDSRAITALPLTARNYTALLGLSAGANGAVTNAATLGRGSQDIAVNGGTPGQNNFSMDGVSIINISGRGVVADANANPGIGIVNPDAIQEFKIQTSQFDAGYGRNPGANVNVVTKSGTNQYHGTAFEFFRNTALNANDFFRKQSPPVGGVPNNSKQVLNQHQWGGTFGGPIKKDKLFFFGSYQQTRQKNGISPYGYSTPTLPGIPKGDRST
ncbi:MAG TPA: carboxypeptidase-like regulatory domain-containing protein, partial [Terriglobales bacterium]|nr:carboxypeptidase-like regulatory domain-containing protein [Terriglobales bacterium]